MKKLFFTLLFTSVFMVVANADSVDYWTISLNKDLLFKGDANNQNPSAIIKKSTVKNANGNLIIQYVKDESSAADWNRTFYINDSKETSYKTIKIDKQSGKVSIPISVLQKILAKNEPVYIYTISLPNDPNLAATVRVRRILLCKLEWS